MAVMEVLTLAKGEETVVVGKGSQAESDYREKGFKEATTVKPKAKAKPRIKMKPKAKTK